MSRRRLLLCCGSIASCVLALWLTWPRDSASSPAGSLPLDPPPGNAALIEQLSGIEHIPLRVVLDNLLGNDAAEELANLAADPGGDPGLRLRAYRALSLYPGATAATALRQGLTDHSADATGMATLYLRAITMALAAIDGALAVDDLAPLLDHSSRDVRAAAARALGATDSPDAIGVLRDRLAIESVSQVQLAIAEALRRLES